MNQKLLILSIFLSVIYDLNALETDKNTNSPLNLQVYFRRNSSVLSTFEEELYIKTFNNYKERNKKDPITSFDLGFRKKIENSNFYLEAEFSELKKGGYSIGRFFCFREASFCSETRVPAGTYNRSQFKSALIYEMIPNILRFSGGIRYLNSELSDGYRFQYSLNFGQKYIGPELGIEVESPKYWNFNLKFNYSYFILGGHIKYQYSTSSSNSESGVLNFISEPSTRYYGQQIGLKVNYSITENYYLSLGYYSINAKVRTNGINIYSEDFPYNNFINTKFQTIYGSNFGERINNLYFEAGIFI